MADLKPFSKTEPCPVCGGGSACRKSDRGVLCKGHSSAWLGDVIPGVDGNNWRCNKIQGGGHTATFALYTGKRQAIPPERQAELDRKREAQKAKEIEAEVKPDDRDGHLRDAFGQLPLGQDDRDSLLNRGFTKLQIEICGFKSVGRYPKVQGNYPDNLPGYNSQYKSLQIRDAGILCPIPDFKDRIVSAQVRLTEVEEDEGRYRWLTKSHLNGEMPIACWDKLEDIAPDAIWAIEGTGIKPALAHFKLCAPVIGASGGLFASSPKNFADTWRHLSAKYRTDKLIVVPDAGDVVNASVAHRIEAQFRLFSQLGCKVRVAWWGQVEKGSSCDIDELDDLSAIALLSVEDFSKILSEHKEERDRKVQARSQQAREECDRLKAQIEKVTSPKPSVERPKGWPKWMRDRTFTADIVQGSRYVQFDAPAPGTILAVRSGLGSGKTHQLEKLFGEGGAFEKKGAIALFSRNSLAYQFIKRIPRFAHLNEENSLLIKDPNSCLCLCTNSLKKFSNPEWFDGKVLIVDEFNSVASHIATSSTHRKDRIESLGLWGEAFKRCESAIILDGNLNDFMVEWAHKQASDKRVIKLANNCVRAKAKVEVFLGSPTKSGKFDSNKLSPFMMPMLASSLPIIVFSDSQKLLEQIEEILIANGKKGIRIDSKTVKPKSEARLFLDDSNEWIARNKPDYVLVSPTAESGVDITNEKIRKLLNLEIDAHGYFPHSYGIFRGVLATDSQMQMMARYRDPDCHWHISVPKVSFLRGSDRDFNLENINAAAAKLLELAEMDLSHLRLQKGFLGETFLKYIEEAASDTNNLFALKIRAKEAFEKANLRECLIFALEEAGHEVSQVSYFADPKLEAEIKEAGELVKSRTSAEIFEAEDIDEKMAEDLSSSWNCTWEDRVKIIKAGYKKLLPGIDETEHWTAEFIKYLRYDNPKAIGAASLLYQFHNPEVCAKKQQNAWAKIATERAVFLPDLHSPHIKVKVLQFLKFEQFLECDCTWHKDSPEIVELVRLGKRDRVVNAIGFTVPKTNKGECDGIGYLRKLLEIVGLKLGKCHRVRSEGKHINLYSLDAEWLGNPVRVAIAEAVARRFEEFDREWVLPEVLQVPPQQVAVEIEPEPETDSDGVDWRGAELELKEAFGGLSAGSVVRAVGQAREAGEKILIWVESAIGRVRLELGLLNLYFE